MSVLLNTCAGDIVIDLFVDACPIACKNFLKLCKLKYYNGCLFYNIQPNLLAQVGDPTGTGKGGMSASGVIHNDASASFQDELITGKKLNKVGMVCMSHYGGKENSNRSQFFINLRGEDMEHLEKTHTIFGEVAEGLEVLHILNSLYCDEDQRPYQDVRIRHTYVLDDPFPDPAGLMEPPESPKSLKPTSERIKNRIPYRPAGEAAVDERSAEEIEASIREKEAKSRAIILEMTGDLPDADIKPPDEVLFVCKLNPVTTDEDLELIFSRFGTIKSCEVIRDSKTGDSLSFAFIEFETAAACNQAYEKMNNVLIDDRRIKVDFSQSVSKLWNRFLAEPRKAPPSGSKKFKFASKPVGNAAIESPKASSKNDKHVSRNDDRKRDRSRTPPRDNRDSSRKGDRRDRQDSRDRRDTDRSYHNKRRDSRSRSREPRRDEPRHKDDRRDDRREDYHKKDSYREGDRREDSRRDDRRKDDNRDRRDDKHHKSHRDDSRDRR